MSDDAQKLYKSIVVKQMTREEAMLANEPDYIPEDKEMYMRKARQGHVYGRTKNIFSEEGIEENGRRTSTSSEWSESGGTRPETVAIQRDDSTSAGESATADGSTGETIGIATGGADAATGSAAERSADSGQRKSARHSLKKVD
jgi:hypothetical protein